MMTDEKYFHLFPTGNSKNDVVWAKSADNVPPRVRVTTKSPSIMVWGGITYYVWEDNTQDHRGKRQRSIISDDLTWHYATISKAPLRRQALVLAARWRATSYCQVDTGMVGAESVPSFITKHEWPPNSPDANNEHREPVGHTRRASGSPPAKNSGRTEAHSQARVERLAAGPHPKFDRLATDAPP